MFENQEANNAAYSFWAKKVRQRINDEKKKNILAPLVPPHAFGIKQPSLEQSYYDVFNLESVDIIDVNESSILEMITGSGIQTEKEGVVQVDMIIFATGFDSVTGSMLKIDIRNGRTEETVQDEWKNGTMTHLGLSVPGFPNMFYMYGPHAPTAFSDGPTCAEVPGEWLTRLFLKLRERGAKRIEAKEESGVGWRKKVHEIWEGTLFPQARSWYQGSNIPGKMVESLNYAAGGFQSILRCWKLVKRVVMMISL